MLSFFPCREFVEAKLDLLEPKIITYFRCKPRTLKQISVRFR